MSDITIKKGLDLKLKGEAEKYIVEGKRSAKYALKPLDFHGITPKMILKEGAKVQAGEPLFHSKTHPEIKFVSPVSGTLSEIRRIAKRKIESVVIDAAPEDDYLSHQVGDLKNISSEQIKKLLLDSGCWPFIKQRPYDIIADAKDTPKSIFISAYATAPLAAIPQFTLKNDKDYFQKGIDVLSKLTTGKVHLSTKKNYPSIFDEIKGVELHSISGPHPAGNVGVQIQALDPINPKETVWTINPEDVVVIGKLFVEGIVDLSRMIAIVGSKAEKPQYVKVRLGATIGDFCGQLSDDVRVISGQVLTGDKASKEDFLGFYHHEVTLIPEGNNYRMFGWMPFVDNHVPSFYSSSFFRLRKKVAVADTNLNGEARAIVVTGKMEQVIPMNIYPMQLLKECMANNIDKMEGLGIYEVAPEDFALVDYISTSKIEAQAIIREGLDLMIREIG